jgi:hypothetical protein
MFPPFWRPARYSIFVGAPRRSQSWTSAAWNRRPRAPKALAREQTELIRAAHGLRMAADERGDFVRGQQAVR